MLTRPWAPRLFIALALLAAAGWHAASLRLVVGRWACVDEFEHLHAAWSMTPAGGSLVPYRDFFEHHTPLLYAVLAPVLYALGPERSFDRGWAAVVVCRAIMWALAGVILWLTYRLGRRVHSRAAGAVAVLATLSSMKFVDRTIEVRPDLLSVPLILGGLLLTLRAVRAEALWAERPSAGRRGATLFWSGVCFSLATLATPKTLFALLGYVPAIIGFLLHVGMRPTSTPGHRLPNWREAVRLGLSHLGGYVAPLAAALVCLGAVGGAGAFVRLNFLLNARWKVHLDKLAMIGEVIYENPMLAALGAAGLIVTVARCVRKGRRERGHLIPAGMLAGLAVGTFIIPVPYDEYFLMPIPLLAVYQGVAMIDLAGAGRDLIARRGGWRGWADAAYWLLAGGTVGGVLWKYHPPMVDGRGAAALFIGCGIAAIGLMAARARHLAVAAALAALLTYPLGRYRTLFALSNEGTKVTMRYVYAHTSPTDPVMDGWDKITAPFRPHAWRFFFLHREIRPMLTGDEWAELEGMMRAGRFRPALVVFDADNQALPAPIIDWIREHYEPVPAGEVGVENALWRPKGVERR